jgi:hypothetical protein
MYTKFWLDNTKETDNLEDLGVDGKIRELVLEKKGGKLWAGCIWLRIRTYSGLL